MILNVLSMDYSRDVKKLLKAIKGKEQQNVESENKKSDLAEDVIRREKHIEQKTQMLKRHLKKEENYGKKLEEDINELEKKKNVLEIYEDTLDKV